MNRNDINRGAFIVMLVHDAQLVPRRRQRGPVEIEAGHLSTTDEAGALSEESIP